MIPNLLPAHASACALINILQSGAKQANGHYLPCVQRGSCVQIMGFESHVSHSQLARSTAPTIPAHLPVTVWRDKLGGFASKLWSLYTMQVLCMRSSRYGTSTGTGTGMGAVVVLV